MRVVLVLALVLGGLAVACDDSGTTGAANPSDPLAGRTYILKVPAGYDSSHPLPLVVAVHAYTSDAAGLEAYFGLDAVADERNFFIVYPEGTIDAAGHRFFSATDACCDFYGTGVDDVAFVDALIDRLEATYAIDPTRIYAVGHSNGGFMSHRLACDLSPRFAAIVSLEGATWMDSSRCQPTSSVAVVEVHGTDDPIINPAGGDDVDGYPGRVYPSVAQTIGSWARFEGCGATTSPGGDPGRIDSETQEPTTVQRWEGCRQDVELWMVQGGTHVPELTSLWPQRLADFLLAHQKGPASVSFASAAAAAAGTGATAKANLPPQAVPSPIPGGAR